MGSKGNPIEFDERVVIAADKSSRNLGIAFKIPVSANLLRNCRGLPK